MPPKAAKRKAAAKASAKMGSADAPVSKKTTPHKRVPRQQKQKKANEPPAAEAPPAELPVKAPTGPGKHRRTLHIRPARTGGHCVLLSHLPAGLREPQLRRFLGQFGRVSRVRVPRASAGVGNTKGVAFVEMADPAAARVVAETLDNYLMFTRLVRCKVLQDPKRLTFAPDGRRRQPQVVKAAVVSDAAASAAASARGRSLRLQAKVERLKQLDPQFEFPLPSL